jgi:hypothetical protein
MAAHEQRLRHLWSHIRDVRVDVFQHKVIYDIPLYGDLIFKNYKLERKNNSIILTTFQSPKPVVLDLEAPSLHNPLNESEPSVGNGTYLESHQPIYREMM